MNLSENYASAPSQKAVSDSTISDILSLIEERVAIATNASFDLEDITRGICSKPSQELTPAAIAGVNAPYTPCLKERLNSILYALGRINNRNSDSNHLLVTELNPS